MTNSTRTSILVAALADLLDTLHLHGAHVHVHLMHNDHGYTTLRTCSPWPAPRSLAEAFDLIAEEHGLHYCPTRVGASSLVVDWEPLPTLAELGAPEELPY